MTFFPSFLKFQPMTQFHTSIRSKTMEVTWLFHKPSQDIQNQIKCESGCILPCILDSLTSLPMISIASWLFSDSDPVVISKQNVS